MHFNYKVIKLVTLLQKAFVEVSTTAINIHLPEFTNYGDTFHAIKKLEPVLLFHNFYYIYLN